MVLKSEKEGYMLTPFKVYEMDVKIFSLRDFEQDIACSVVSDFIDKCLCKNEKFLEFHKKNFYKQYVMNMPYPLEQDGIYKKEKVYTVKIRTVDRELMDYLMMALTDTTTEYFKGLTVKVRVVPRKHICKIYSMTPIIIKLKGIGYWKNHISFEKYEKLLKINLVKKFNQFTNEKLDEDFQLYTNICKLNRKPIKVCYKDIILLGDKFDMEIADNETAQELSYFSLASGWGENNGRGCGYVNCKFL